MRGARAPDARAMALDRVDDGEQRVETKHVQAVDPGDRKGVLGQQLGQILEEISSRFVAVVVEVQFRRQAGQAPQGHDRIQGDFLKSIIRKLAKNVYF